MKRHMKTHSEGREEREKQCGRDCAQTERKTVKRHVKGQKTHQTHLRHPNTCKNTLRGERNNGREGGDGGKRESPRAVGTDD